MGGFPGRMQGQKTVHRGLSAAQALQAEPAAARQQEYCQNGRNGFQTAFLSANLHQQQDGRSKQQQGVQRRGKGVRQEGRGQINRHRQQDKAEGVFDAVHPIARFGQDMAAESADDDQRHAGTQCHGIQCQAAEHGIAGLANVA